MNITFRLLIEILQLKDEKLKQLTTSFYERVKWGDQSFTNDDFIREVDKAIKDLEALMAEEGIEIHRTLNESELEALEEKGADIRTIIYNNVLYSLNNVALETILGI